MSERNSTWNALTDLLINSKLYKTLLIFDSCSVSQKKQNKFVIFYQWQCLWCPKFNFLHRGIWERPVLTTVNLKEYTTWELYTVFCGATLSSKTWIKATSVAWHGLVWRVQKVRTLSPPFVRIMSNSKERLYGWEPRKYCWVFNSNVRRHIRRYGKL